MSIRIRPRADLRPVLCCGTCERPLAVAECRDGGMCTPARKEPSYVPLYLALVCPYCGEEPAPCFSRPALRCGCGNEFR